MQMFSASGLKDVVCPIISQAESNGVEVGAFNTSDFHTGDLEFASKSFPNLNHTVILCVDTIKAGIQKCCN